MGHGCHPRTNAAPQAAESNSSEQVNTVDAHGRGSEQAYLRQLRVCAAGRAALEAGGPEAVVAIHRRHAWDVAHAAGQCAPAARTPGLSVRGGYPARTSVPWSVLYSTSTTPWSILHPCPGGHDPPSIAPTLAGSCPSPQRDVGGRVLLRVATLKFPDLAMVSAVVGHRNFSGWSSTERVRGDTDTPTRRGPAGPLRRCRSRAGPNG